MKKIKDFSKNEILLLVMLVLSVILVVSSWGRITEKASKVFKIYTKGEIENSDK